MGLKTYLYIALVIGVVAALWAFWELAYTTCERNEALIQIKEVEVEKEIIKTEYIYLDNKKEEIKHETFSVDDTTRRNWLRTNYSRN